MRFQKLQFEVTGFGLEITYLEEADIHPQTGINELRILQVPHEQLDNVLLDDLFDSVIQIVEDARTRRRAPVDSFIGPR